MHSVHGMAWNELKRDIADDLNIFEALNELLQRDPGFQTGQRSPKAKMDAVTQSQVRVRRASDIKNVRIFPLLFVTI